MQEVLRTRILTAGGALLAATGLAAAMVAGPAFAATTGTTSAEATVENTLEMSAVDASFALTGAPGASLTPASSLTVKSNNSAGYKVTALATGANFTGNATGNADTFPVSTLKIEGTAADTTTPATVETTTAKSAEAGDVITVDYAMTMPWVNADTYSAGLEFTVAAN